jgi:hypothetical protein
MVIMVKRSGFRSNGRSFEGNSVTISLRYSSSPITAIRTYLTGRGEGGNLRSDRYWLLGTLDPVTGPVDHTVSVFALSINVWSGRRLWDLFDSNVAGLTT